MTFDLKRAVRRIRKSASRTWDAIAEGAPRTAAKAAEIAGRPLERAVAALSPTVLPGFERFLQGDGYTCGVESSRMVLAYHGRRMRLPRARALLGANEDEGVDEAAITRFLRSQGLRVRELGKPARAHLMAAIDREEPVIVLLDNGDHWGVVYGYGRASIYLADPSFLRAPLPIVSWPTFKARWTAGYGLAIGERR